MLGSELRKAREEAGLTQEVLAHKTGIDRSYISELEHDKKSPTVNRLFKLCDAIGVQPSALLARVERLRAARPKGRPHRD
jgi:transcriptional regulator with XRE-family HTH domain